MNDTIESVVNHFEEAEVQYQADRETGVVWAVLPSAVGLWYAQVRVEADLLEVAVHHPLRIPEDQRAAMAELLVRVGPWNTLVRLEMDYDEGHLMARGRMGFDEAVGLDTEEVHGPIIGTLLSMELIHPAVMAVLHEGKSAKDAAELLEGDETKNESPHAGRFNLPLPEGGLPCPELPEDGLRNN